jgi:hypothetical protein
MNSSNVNQKPLQIIRNAPRKRRGQRSSNNKKSITKNSNREEAPVSMGFRSEFSQPDLSSRGQNTFIRHREYVADINGSILFAVVASFGINPGLAKSFPWLSQVAQRFEKYRFRKLRYTFETTSPTSAVGSMMLVPDFDAEDPPPISKVQALSYKSSVRTQIWERIALEAKSEDLKALPQYYIRAGALLGSYDIKTYDVGNLFVCSAGAVGPALVGELWVEYEVELLAPNIQPNNLVVGPGIYTYASSFDANNNSLFGLQTDGANRQLSYGIGFSINTAGTLLTFTQAFIGMVVIQIVGADADEPDDLTVSGTATIAIQSETIDTTDFTLTGMVYVTASAGQTFGCTALCVTLPVTVQVWISSYDFPSLV